MRYERLIARRFLGQQSGRFSRPLVRTATWSVALGVAVMVLSVCILRGFQKNITSKVTGFGSHIVVRSQAVGHYYEPVPLSVERDDVARLHTVEGVRRVQAVASMGGMVKTDEQIEGILFKGIGTDYDTTFFASCLVEGRMPCVSDSLASTEVLLSVTLSRRLGLGLGDKVPTYFWQEGSYRARVFRVVGLYRTDLTDFDDHYLVGDLRQVQRLNGWAPDEVSALELLVENFGLLDRTAEAVYDAVQYDLTVETIVEDNAATFAWLRLLNSNIILILVVMAAVCVVAVISSLLIMIFEQTQMIGVLKTLGATNRSVRHIFLLKATAIAGKGIVAGDLIAAVLSGLQVRFRLIGLDSESYSMSYVPVDINGWVYVLVSAATLAVCIAAMLLPASHIARVTPSRSLRFE